MRQAVAVVLPLAVIKTLIPAGFMQWTGGVAVPAIGWQRVQYPNADNPGNLCIRVNERGGTGRGENRPCGPVGKGMCSWRWLSSVCFALAASGQSRQSTAPPAPWRQKDAGRKTVVCGCRASTCVEVPRLTWSLFQADARYRVASKNRRNCACTSAAQGHPDGWLCSKASGHCSALENTCRVTCKPAPSRRSA